MATALRLVGPTEPTTARGPSHPSLERSISRDNGGDGERAAQHVIDNAHSARLVPAWDADRQVVFTHPGTVDSEELA